ncbi:unnamed protein product [Protopolystoma xenopodis]|uniref:Kinetochore protein NDC80 n=1 Tax=Protopolystoma xenopodis TaxID=117903 RepID=A0A3S5ACP7_9PLAT|nr:unnamed protein product [Protopolystoma xenopodis]
MRKTGSSAGLPPSRTSIPRSDFVIIYFLGLLHQTNFLENTSYSNKLSLKDLQSPSLREISNIFEHIVCQLDQSYRMMHNDVKFDVEFASKQYLATPGAMHAWPYIWTKGGPFLYDPGQNINEEPMGRILFDMQNCLMPTGDLTDEEAREFSGRLGAIYNSPTLTEVEKKRNHLTTLEQEIKKIDSTPDEISKLRGSISSDINAIGRYEDKLKETRSKHSSFESHIGIALAQLKEKETEVLSLKMDLENIEKLARAQEESG